MKSIVIYYSFKGHTKAFAKKKAEELSADIVEIRESKNRSVLSAYTSGCLAALRLKSVKIKPYFVEYDKYDKVILCAPIWAGAPAPAFNSVVEALPKGTEVEMHFVSGSGKSGAKARVIAKLEKQGCKVLSYTDIKESKQ